MKLPFSHYFGPISADVQVTIDCVIEWENGTAKLDVEDVLDTSGKFSLWRDERWNAMSELIAEEDAGCSTAAWGCAPTLSAPTMLRPSKNAPKKERGDDYLG